MHKLIYYLREQTKCAPDVQKPNNTSISTPHANNLRINLNSDVLEKMSELNSGLNSGTIAHFITIRIRTVIPVIYRHAIRHHDRIAILYSKMLDMLSIYCIIGRHRLERWEYCN